MLHHYLFITLLLGDKPISVLAIQTVLHMYIESKMHRLYRKKKKSHLGSNPDPCYIKNLVITNRVIIFSML